MAQTEKQIRQIIKSGNAVFVGVGNNMRGDDGVGPYIISNINFRLSSVPFPLRSSSFGGQVGEASLRSALVPSPFALRAPPFAKASGDRSGDRRPSSLSPQPSFIDAGQMPENYIGVLAKLKPRTVIIIDAVDFKAKPAEIKMLEAGKIKQGAFSTHGMSLSLFAEQVERISGAKVLIVGIQPQSTVLKEGLTDVVKARADELIELIMKFL